MKIQKYKFPVFLFLLTFLISAAYITKSNPDKRTSPNLIADSLQNIGHASMKIKTAEGKVIYIDPFQPGDYSDSADIILVTHGHGDHNQTNLVTKKSTCTTITHVQSNIGGIYQSFNIDGIKIYSVAAYNDNHNINQCVGYVIEFNGIKLYHAGDTDNIPEMTNLADSNITYALLPIDGFFNMSSEEATTAANNIQANFSIPIHTERTPDDYNEENVALFIPTNRLLLRHGETIALVSPSTDAENFSVFPSDIKLYQSYPNPFNPSTKISFSIPTSSFVTLKVFNLNGSEIATLVEEQMPAGNYTREWSAVNMPSGVYFYRLQTGTFTDTKKFVLLK